MAFNTLKLDLNAKQVDQLIEKLKLADELTDELINKLQLLEQYAKAVNDECFYDVSDVMRLTKYSKPTVLAMFNRKDFPTCTVGRRKIIKKSAFWKRFDEPMVGEYEL
ncbi:helix-turn-helix domain-containing protein [Eubacterium sp.]